MPEQSDSREYPGVVPWSVGCGSFSAGGSGGDRRLLHLVRAKCRSGSDEAGSSARQGGKGRLQALNDRRSLRRNQGGGRRLLVHRCAKPRRGGCVSCSEPVSGLRPHARGPACRACSGKRPGASQRNASTVGRAQRPHDANDQPPLKLRRSAEAFAKAEVSVAYEAAKPPSPRWPQAIAS